MIHRLLNTPLSIEYFNEKLNIIKYLRVTDIGSSQTNSNEKCITLTCIQLTYTKSSKNKSINLYSKLKTRSPIENNSENNILSITHTTSNTYKIQYNEYA